MRHSYELVKLDSNVYKLTWMFGEEKHEKYLTAANIRKIANDMRAPSETREFLRVRLHMKNLGCGVK